MVTFILSLIPLADNFTYFRQTPVFTYSPITTTTRDRFDVRPLLRAYEINLPFKILSLELEPDNELNDIHTSFVHLLLRLTLHEAKESCYDNIATNPNGGFNTTMRNELGRVQSEARSHYERIIKMLDILNPVLADHLNLITEPDSLPDRFTKMVAQMTAASNRFDIEKTILRIGPIEESQGDNQFVG